MKITHENKRVGPTKWAVSVKRDCDDLGFHIGFVQVADQKMYDNDGNPGSWRNRKFEYSLSGKHWIGPFDSRVEARDLLAKEWELNSGVKLT